jgi:hypothetical protein
MCIRTPETEVFPPALAMSINLEKVQQNNSVESFLTALAVNAGLLAFQVSAFVVLKAKLERIYSPRSYLPPPECASKAPRPCPSLTTLTTIFSKRADELPKGPWRWLPVVLFSPLEEIVSDKAIHAQFLSDLVYQIHKNGLDA